MSALAVTPHTMRSLGQRLPACPTELETGIFEAAYGAPMQRRRRHIALVGLAAKHTLRGLAFSWPAYVLALAAFASDKLPSFAFLILLAPALVVSGVILARGVRDDFRNKVRGVLLPEHFLKVLLWPPKP